MATRSRRPAAKAAASQPDVLPDAAAPALDPAPVPADTLGAAVPAKKAGPVKPAASAAAAKTSKPAAAKRGKQATAAKPAKEAKETRDKPAKLKVVRDSFTIPKAEYAVLQALKERALTAGHAAKKSELLRAGIQALAGLPDAAFLAAVTAVEPLKTGRPAKD